MVMKGLVDFELALHIFECYPRCRLASSVLELPEDTPAPAMYENGQHFKDDAT